MKLPALALLLLLPLAALPVRGAEEPEAVYGKFHRAVMAGDLEAMLENGPAQRRAEIQGMSAPSRDAALKMAQYMMPRAFTVERRIVTGNNRSTLIVSGPGDDGNGKLQTIYGTVKMVLESGNWKVDETTWSNEKPSILASPQAAAAGKGSAKAGAPAKLPAGASAYTETPTRKFGEAKQECVYKPVMTAKDIEACK